MRIALHQGSGVPERSAPSASRVAMNSEKSGDTATRIGRRRASSISMNETCGTLAKVCHGFWDL